jgi:hypothetical protein
MLPRRRRPNVAVRSGFAITLLALVAALGCGRKTHAPVVAAAPKPPPIWPVRSPDFRDLVPGQIRQVTPVVPLERETSQQQDGKTITLAGTDFQGVETALYALKPRAGGGVEVELDSVETSNGDELTKETQPRVPLLQFPDYVRYIRLLYMLRVSDADHNFAVLGSDDVDRLNALTKQVQAAPTSGCQNLGHTFCRWVPKGIAVNQVNLKTQ